MEWLEQNLRSAYPFADLVQDPIAAIFADALVTCTEPGPYTLTVFNPQALTNALVRIQKGATVLLDTTTATPTVMGPYTVLIGTDPVRGSSYRFICDTAGLSTYAFLTTPVQFTPRVCNFAEGAVQSLNGLTGNVTLQLSGYGSVDAVENVTTVSFPNPENRIDCSETDCAKVFRLNNQTPDQFGSLAFANDGCHRVIPHPTEPSKLLIYNFCTPCLDCDDVDALNAKQATQGQYYYQLSGIYHDQFNRYQQDVAKANSEIEAAMSRSDLTTPTGVIDIGGRAYNPPYFSQLVLAITNSTLYGIQIVLTVSITPSDLASQLTYVAGSGQIHRYLLRGEQLDIFSGFPGTLTITLQPQETVSIASEMHRSNILAAPEAGFWNVQAAVTYLTGPGTLPSPATVTKQFPILLQGAPPTTGP